MKKARYSEELKEKIIKQHVQDGRSKKSLTSEYNLGQGTLSYWITQFRKESETTEDIRDLSEVYKENNQLKKALQEVQKENAFLKKAAAFFAKEIE